MAAQAVLAYQTIISRNLDPQQPAVLTVGAIEAGRDNNVIPASAVLKLNLRWFSHECVNCCCGVSTRSTGHRHRCRGTG